MTYVVRSTVLTRRVLALITMFLVVLGLGILGPAMARPSSKAAASGVEPNAGTWKTWVLTSGDQFRSAAPPDDAATKKEIAQLKDMVAKRDDAALQQIAYWNDGPPSYHWNVIGTTAFAAKACLLHHEIGHC